MLNITILIKLYAPSAIWIDASFMKWCKRRGKWVNKNVINFFFASEVRVDWLRQRQRVANSEEKQWNALNYSNKFCWTSIKATTSHDTITFFPPATVSSREKFHKARRDKKKNFLEVISNLIFDVKVEKYYSFMLRYQEKKKEKCRIKKNIELW